MRRKLETVYGRLLCHFVALAVALPTLSMCFVARASTQLVTRDLWAVMPFVDDQGGQLGSIAASAFQTELSKRADDFRPAIDVVSEETVNRTLTQLGLSSPVTDQTSLLRVGQELRATVLITGSVVNSRVVTSGNEKQADVIVRVEAVNVASGIAINGTVLEAKSGVKSAKTADADLISDALTQGASNAVSQVLNQTLPTGTVLNTYNNTVLVNQGTRSGFKPGQNVIVLRGNEQVASGKVASVEPDESNVNVSNTIKGVEPGDRVQVIFTVPNVSPEFQSNGGIHVIKPRSHGNNAALISVLLVVGLIAVLLGGSGGGGTSSISNVVAQADSNASDAPASPTNPSVLVSWKPNAFAGGHAQQQFWQVFRSDISTTPVAIVAGDQRSVLDSAKNIYGGQTFYTGISTPQGSGICSGLTSGGTIAGTGLSPGTPYTYGVNLVYALTQGDLPTSTSSSGGSGGLTASGGLSGTTASGGLSGTTASGGLSGTTGSTATGGGTGGLTGTTGSTGGLTGTGGATGTTASTTGTTAGTTGTTSTSGSGSLCYFVSAETQSGLATPLTPPTLISPADGASLTGPVPFSFTSSIVTNQITLQYVLEVSANDPTFQRADTYTFPSFVSGQAGSLSTPTENLSATNLPSFITKATVLYFRIGVRNVADNPGPVPDASGQRYVFSVPRQITKANNPPGPP